MLFNICNNNVGTLHPLRLSFPMDICSNKIISKIERPKRTTELIPTNNHASRLIKKNYSEQIRRNLSHLFHTISPTKYYNFKLCKKITRPSNQTTKSSHTKNFVLVQYHQCILILKSEALTEHVWATKQLRMSAFKFFSEHIRE